MLFILPTDSYVDDILYELDAYKQVGGCSIMEGSYHGCATRSWDDLKMFSEKSGVNVVCSVGVISVASGLRPPEYVDKSEDELKAMFEDEIKNGVKGSSVLPGMLKVFYVDEADISAFRACARISAETGMGMQIHTQTPGFTIDDAIRMSKMAIEEFGADPGKILWLHMCNVLQNVIPLSEHVDMQGQPIDYAGFEKLFKLGVRVSIDNFGNPGASSNDILNMYRPDDLTCLMAVNELIKRGYASQIMLGHDFCTIGFGQISGGYGMTRVPEFVCGMLKKLGHEDAVHTMMVTNPMEFLTY